MTANIIPASEHARDARDLTILEFLSAGYSVSVIASMFKISPDYIRALRDEAGEAA